MEKKNTLLSKIKWKYFIRYVIIAAIGLIFTILTFTTGLKQSNLFLLEKITINITLAVSLSLVVGFLGELSLGHAGFMCVGAYFGGITSMILDNSGLMEGKGVLSFIISMVVGAVVAGICGLIIGLPTLRLRGDYLAIVTLAFGEIVKTIFDNVTFTIGGKTVGGPIGIKTPRFDKQYFFIIGFIIVIVTIAVIQNLIRSKHGRAITAIRDNEIAARATGINVTKYKLTGFIISAIFAGIAGVMYSFSNSNVSAGFFDYNKSIEILVMVVLGGMGSINGAIISAAFITFLDVKLQSVLTGNLAVLSDMIYALVLIGVIIYNNAPALRSFRDKFNAKRLASRLFGILRNKHGYVDDEGKWDRVPTKINMDELLSVDVVVNESVLSPDKEEK
ncbi:MAG: branched-chain amino acid ABC transporter permease [Clostridia bacterium]|nr:branched-chain amino acid ABC transporter permease [Clostridia bacterium]